MVKKLLGLIYILFSILLIIYVAAPNLEFPAAPSDSVQSDEPGDTENILRRAYFTNFNRKEAIEHYKESYSLTILGLKIPAVRLNHPPEDAQIFVRDQTLSTYLEELVYPLRESVFINGFEAGSPLSLIEIGDNLWWQKLTIRSYPSNVFIRTIVTGISMYFLWVIVESILTTVKRMVIRK